MRKIAVNFSLLVGMILCLTVISASAQTNARFKSHIPFAFIAGQQTFAAGEYTIQVVNPESDKLAISVRSADGREGRILMTTPKVTDPRMETAKLVFNRYGNEYVLAEMLTPDFGVEFRGARAAGQLARRRINTDPRRETVALLWQGR